MKKLEKINKYTVIFHSAEEGGYWVDVPSLPGCYSQGGTFEKAKNNIEEAIELYLEALEEQNKEIPLEESIVISEVLIDKKKLQVVK